MKRWPIVLAAVILEMVAVLGALQLIRRGLWPPYSYYSLWELTDMAWPAFLAIATAVMVLVTRQLSRTLRIAIPIGIVGALVLTMEIVSVVS